MHFADCGAVILLHRYHTFIDKYGSGLAGWLADGFEHQLLLTIIMILDYIYDFSIAVFSS